MTTRPAHLVEREFQRLLRLLDAPGQSADRSRVTTSDVEPRHAPLTLLRVVALIGAGLAALLVVFAFSTHIVLGVVAVALSPAVPLALVVGADRVLAR